MKESGRRYYSSPRLILSGMYLPDYFNKLFSAASQNIRTLWFRLQPALLIYPTDVLEQTVRNAIASADAVHNRSLKNP